MFPIFVLQVIILQIMLQQLLSVLGTYKNISLPYVAEIEIALP